MKRYISLALAAVVLVFSLSVPSYAAENNWIDVLDFCNPNDYVSNIVNCAPLDWVTFSYNLGSHRVGYIDLVVRFDNPGTPYMYIGNDPYPSLSCIKISDNIYRFYGKVDIVIRDSLILEIHHGGGNIEFLSVRVSPNSYLCYDSPVNGYVVYGGGDEQDFYYNSDDDYEGVTLYGSSDFHYQDYTAYLYFSDWRKYDSLDVQFIASSLSISSISVIHGDNLLPFTVSYFDADNATDRYIVGVSIDLSSVDRNISVPVELVVTGDVPALDDWVGYFAVWYSSGFVSETIPNSESAFFYKIKVFFTDFLSVRFDSLGSGIISSIKEWGQKIVEAVNANSSSADKAINKGNQVADQLNDLTDQMNSMDKPDLIGAGDISAIISPGDLSSYTVFLSTVVNAPYIGQVVMLSLILSLAAYVLFGKR